MSWSVCEEWGITKEQYGERINEAVDSCERERGYFEPITEGITKLSGVFNSKDEAKEAMRNYIRNHHGACVSVAYYDTAITSNEGEKIDKKAKDLRKKAEAEIEKLKEYAAKHLVTLQKAKFVSCPDCESKLRKDMLKSDRERIHIVYHMRGESECGYYAEGFYEVNYCPVCKTKLQNKTVQDAIAAKRGKIQATLTEYQNYAEKIKKNPKKEKEVFYGIYIQTYLG